MFCSSERNEGTIERGIVTYRHAILDECYKLLPE
jgi:hypothetical protein